MPGIEIKGKSKIATYRHGGRVGLKEGTPYIGSRSVSKETYEEAKKDVGDIKGKVHHLKTHKKEGKKRLSEIRKKSDYSPFYSEKTLKEVYPERDKGWKKKKKIEQN